MAQKSMVDNLHPPPAVENLRHLWPMFERVTDAYPNALF